MEGINRFLKKAYWLARDFRFVVQLRNGAVPVRYFDGRLNVGDLVNPYLISKITGKITVSVKSDAFRHILGVGSIMHNASHRNVVWGSGLISADRLPSLDKPRSLEIQAIRGEKTKAVLEEHGINVDDALLGDPALLMPYFFEPNIKKKYKLGIVPHYVDKSNPVLEKLSRLPGVKTIEVESFPEQFIQEISECEVIASSSLHGLILSDSYEIPNIRLDFKGPIVGGDFKFLDYYSTTNNKAPTFIDVKESCCIFEVYRRIFKESRVSHYLYDKNELLKSFPAKFVR